MIPQAFILELVSKCDIEDVMSSYVNVKRTGRNSMVLCPFHSEKTPSLMIYRDNQSFYCFGCGAGGDVLSFIMQAENLGYIEAVKLLASRVGMTVPENGIDDEQSKFRERLQLINREAAKFFNSCLKLPIGKSGYDYFKQRGLSDKIIATYGLGFAPDTWDSLTNHLKNKGYTNEELQMASLVGISKTGSIYDTFRNRVIFPIIDLRGNVIAFGGRVLDDSKPKYLNSSDTLLFKKSRNLFSLNFAKGEIKDKIILAEGYMDVIAIYAAGFKNVVATLGTAVTGEQVRLMSKYAKQVVIAYDSDDAGQRATHRAINLFSEAGMTARVLNMDGAKDPDEYIKKFGTQRFEILINNATDVIEHELKNLRQSVDLGTSEGKIEYLKRAILILSEIRNPFEREVYAGTVARESGSLLDTILSQTTALIKKKKFNQEKREFSDILQRKSMTRDKVNPQKVNNVKEATAEEFIIAHSFKYPDCINKVLKRIDSNYFVTDFNKRVFNALVEKNNNEQEINLSLMAADFSHEEISAISGMIARNNDILDQMDTLDIYINVLIEYSQKLHQSDIKNTDVADIELYRQRLKNKK